ncbi:hypothetical protein DPEC_G00311570 [Dallia pectoralis]|uniref:Uncharacterized protein n=1 Tax=Dallia pectoralis TaxID=75939 RepID=A0ACC2FBN7_DALPE|nr:hypothetical protein DPEC_G00311570 [Dallia pectoralis]
MPPPGVCTSIMQARYKKDGIGTLANPENFNNQDFQIWKQKCLNENVRFIDKMFPPDKTSIGKDMEGVVWKRPRELVENPHFIVDGISRFDFWQGAIGNCWFLASIGALTKQEDILQQVVPLKQNFKAGYCGIFHFRFWRFGRWVDVLIDDKLPTINGKLIFVQSKTCNEFWPALLEKAYAKVCGSYTAIHLGAISEAMMDFTGGVHITLRPKEDPSKCRDLLLKATKSQSLIGCSTPPGETPEIKEAPNGLVCGHAYTVTGVKQFMSQGILVNLVRIFNPWGEVEWRGDWSDGSSLWNTVSPNDRKMYQKVKDDGEFWMTMEDFFLNFAEVTICCINLNFLDNDNTSLWMASFHDGKWVPGVTAGGCEKQNTFWINPQYRVKIEGLDNDCSENNILVSLMQKSLKRTRCSVENLSIGFSIYQVPAQFNGEREKFPVSFFNSSRLVGGTKFPQKAREVMEMFSLKPGEYLVVPSTKEPNKSGSFILSILSKAKTSVHENSNEQIVQKIRDTTKSPTSPHTPKPNSDLDNNQRVFLTYSDEFQEVDAQQIQRTLNENLLKGHKDGTLDFCLESCQSMVALMDSSVSGKLNSEEFQRFWRKVTQYRDIFFRADVDRSGNLSLSELRNAIVASGLRISDYMLCLMALRYGGSSGKISLESFISLVLRMNRMESIFRHLSKGEGVVSLREKEWMQISMYT